MGSPSAELNVLESFRPWYQNGLQYIYKDALPGLDQFEKDPSRQRSLASGATEQSRPPRPGGTVRQPSTGPGTPPPVQNNPDHAQKGFRQPTPAARPSRVPPARSTPQNNKLNFPDPGSWPDPWNTLASRITPRLQIFWTYSQLGQDLSGQADAARRKLFQSLIGYMGLPKGAISFWPCTSWDGSRFENRPDVFWKGVQSYGVKFVACFGDNTRSIIAPDAPSNAASVHINNVQLVMLQDPDFLKTLPPDEQQLLCISLLRLPLF